MNKDRHPVRGLFLRSAALVGLAATAPLFFSHAAIAQSTQGTSAGSIEEVTVTATRREEKLGKVPVAVTALTPEKISEAHITNFVDLPAQVAGATWVSTKGPSTANIEIRGQAATNDAPALEVPVAIYQDDMYFGTLADFSSDFYDASGIQILRGPQGTTFGRNVVGGAVVITSNKPELGVQSGAVEVSVNDFPGAEANGYFNLPLSDDAAGRIAYSVKEDKGYVHDITTNSYLSNQNVLSARGSILYQPVSDLSILFLAQIEHENDLSAGYTAVGQGAVAASIRALGNPWDVLNDVNGYNHRDSYSGQIRADWTRSFGTLTSITSYHALQASYSDDGDNTPLPLNDPSLNNSEDHDFAEELRLVSPSGQSFEYVAGLYYSYENLYKNIFLGLNGNYPQSLLSVFTRGTVQHSANYQDAKVQTFAPYAELTYHITDELALIAGARYTIEDKDGFTAHSARTVFYGNPYTQDWGHQWEDFTPRGIIQYTPRQDLMFYGSVSTGFKGGGYSITSTTPLKAATPLTPEKTTSYEVGSKALFFDDHLSVNLALYQADTRNEQVRTLVAGVLSDTNAGVERVRGAELEAVAQVTDALKLGVNYAYTDAIFTSFVGCAAGGINCSGNEVPFVPKNDLTVSLDYTIPFLNGALMFHADDQNTSNQNVSALANSQPGGQPRAVPYTGKDNFLNSWFIYEPDNANWRVQLWGKNLLNHYIISNLANYYFYFLTPAEYGAGDREVDRGPLSPPRQIGATVSFRF